MDIKYAIPNISQALTQRLYPTVLLWNRLEGRPRTHDFDRALKAELRDALWMLTKQWQMGEFEGEDAGSPVFAKAQLSATRLSKYKAAGNTAQEYEENLPLETKVEQRKLVFEREGQRVSLDIRLLMGRQWLKLIKAVPGAAGMFIGLYPFQLPPQNNASALLYAHAKDWQQYAAISGRCMDGYLLYQYLKAQSVHQASDGLQPMPSDSDRQKIDAAGAVFTSWFEALYYQPVSADNNAWEPDRLEYRFGCSAPDGIKEKVLTAEEYYSGHLDWYSFNFDPTQSTLGAVPGTDTSITAKKITNTFIPATVQFPGMPNTRWWTFEDGKTSFGNVNPSTTDLSKLLLMEFALIYANDWFIVPFTVPNGSLATIEGLSVTNNFGERFWITAASKNTGNHLKDWNMFSLDSKKLPPSVPTPSAGLLLAPAAIKVQQGNPLENIQLIRDEMANMVWAIESVVPAVTGQGTNGKEYGQEVFNYQQNLVQLKLKMAGETNLLLADINAISGTLPAGLQEAKTILQNILNALANPVSDIVLLQDRLADAKQKMKTEGMNTVHETDVLNTDIPYAANISYQAMTAVPEHWIPFVPVHIKATDNREIQLQRASMLRIIEGDPDIPVKIKAQTSLMREGLDQIPKQAYYLHEEEVPRAGINVSVAFQRTRWTNGEVFTWVGNEKTSGRGEGSSGLAFDKLADSNVNNK